MSLYNLVNGVSPATFFILPMLGKHPDEYPRFRDCFIGMEGVPEYDDCIAIFTRTGGGNRDEYQAENDAMAAMPEFVADRDDDFDNTYATWVFRVPGRWRADFDAIRAGSLQQVSAAYRAEMSRVFPKLAEKFDAIFAAAAAPVPEVRASVEVPK